MRSLPGVALASCLMPFLWASNAYALDGDGDGISDKHDLCPAENSAGADVDFDGCVDRNYLLIVLDDVGLDKVSAYDVDHPSQVGSFRPLTANIDSLASAGLRFTRAWGYPACSPARASLQTGVHPLRHGAGIGVDLDMAGVDPDAWDMLGEMFSAEGYATAHIGKWHLGTEDASGNIGYPLDNPTFIPMHPARSGYQFYDGSLVGSEQEGDYNTWVRTSWTDLTGSGTMADETVHNTQAIDDSVIDWIAAQTGPWLASVAFEAPHGNTLDTGEAVWTYDLAIPGCYESAALTCIDTHTCTDERRQVYQALFECVDLKIGDILATMDPVVLDRTTVVVVGDNGTPRGVAQGEFSKKGRGKTSAHETGLRVPLIIADGKTWRTGAPGVITSPGRTTTATVEMVDIYGTLIADALKTPSPSPDARSFLGCLTDTSPDCGFGTPIGYAELFELKTNGVTLKSATTGMRQGDVKSTFIWDKTLQCLSQKTYNLANDVWETAPLDNTTPEATSLRDAFVALHAGTGSWAEGRAICF